MIWGDYIHKKNKNNLGMFITLYKNPFKQEVAVGRLGTNNASRFIVTQQLRLSVSYWFYCQCDKSIAKVQ